MPEFTQEALFDDSEVVGTGQPYPWNVDEAAEPAQPFKIERLDDQLPFEDAA